jgi:hypothetical protein
MLQIFNAESPTETVVPLVASKERSRSKEAQAESVSRTLAEQLHAETEQRFFLEEAIDLLDLKTEEDSSVVANVLNLLNRTAGTTQILIADQNGRVFEASFCLGEDHSELSVGTLTWLIDQAQRKCRKHANEVRSSISQLTLDQETLTMPLLGRAHSQRWMIAIGNSKKRSLQHQRALFESARRLLGRLATC